MLASRHRTRDLLVSLPDGYLTQLGHRWLGLIDLPYHTDGRVDRSRPWIWTGDAQNGYGRISVTPPNRDGEGKRRKVGAHQIGYFLRWQRLPEVVRHTAAAASTLDVNPFRALEGGTENSLLNKDAGSNDFSGPVRLDPEDKDRLYGKIDRDSDGCHEWKCQLDSDGYPRFWAGGRYRRAHRVVHFLATGEDPPVVMHMCDNPSCCRPEHLCSGTVASNVADRQAKDRQAKGSANGRSKLSSGEVAEIRRRYREEESASYRSLGEKYGLHKASIGAIVRRESYQSV